MHKLFFPLLNCFVLFSLTSCLNPTSSSSDQDPITQDPITQDTIHQDPIIQVRKIIVSDYSLPESLTTYKYEYSDGSTTSSDDFIPMSNGRKGQLFGTAGTDTTVWKGNNMIGYYYSNGSRIVYNAGNGILWQPYEINAGQTYSASGEGFNGNDAHVSRFDITAKYSYQDSLPVGNKMVKNVIYVVTTLNITNLINNTNLLHMTVYEYFGKGLGCIKEVDSNGSTLKIVNTITADEEIVFSQN
jgi:hypothetical protein